MQNSLQKKKLYLEYSLCVLGINSINFIFSFVEQFLINDNTTDFYMYTKPLNL